VPCSISYLGSHLQGVGGGLWGALKPPLGLYVQNVEQIRGLGLAGEVDTEVEAPHSARAIIVELESGDSRMAGGSAPNWQLPAPSHLAQILEAPPYLIGVLHSGNPAV
jgi:hypothetical protein